MSHLTLSLLGSFQATRDGSPAARFRSDKVRALLAYLAVEAARPHTRASLCGLLWPNLPDDAALHNLSQTLLRLREALGDGGPGAAFVLASRPTIQWNSASAHSLDVAEFSRLAASADPGDLAQATAMYQGEFLAGFALPGCEAFEEWLLFTRERLARLAITALDTLTATSLASASYAQAEAHARRQLALDPWRERAYRQLMRALAGRGDRAAALAVYARCSQLLHDELGVEPDEETRALVEQIRAQRLGGASGEQQPITPPFTPRQPEPAVPGGTAAMLAAQSLPAERTPLVGRERDLEAIGALLRQPGVRLLTLVGLGGMGKTRLALALAHAHGATYADGVCFVPLAPLTSAAAVPTAIANALGLPLHGEDPLTTLVRALRGRALLLVLDNFEHVLDGAGVVAALLEAAPRLCIVSTSRERLNLGGEHLYVVEGLEFGPGATPAELSAAVRLFVASARRRRADFTLDAATLPAVQRICRQVQGMPLGLELAAAWTETLAPLEVAAEIERSLDLLAGEWRDLPERQRSIRAVFELTWRLLGEAERAAFKQLGMFRGGFTRQAAQAVAGASPVALQRLIQKVLLRLRTLPDGSLRYELHELLRQFALEQLAAVPAERDAAGLRHASYYLGLVERKGPAAPGSDQEAWSTRIEGELDNLRAALGWARETGEADMGLRLACALWPFWQQRCHLSEGRAWLEGFLTAAGADNVPPELRANALIGAGWLAHDQDDFARADRLFEEGLRIERALGRAGWLTAVLAHRGIMARGQGQYARATALLEESVALARAAGDVAGTAYALFRLGVVTRERGDFTRAAVLYEECLASYGALGDRVGAAFALLGIADIARDQGDAAAMLAPATEALEVGRALGQAWVTGFALNNLALAAMMRGELRSAEQLAVGALALFNAQGVRGGMIELLITQGQIALAGAEHERAWQLLQAGVAQGWPAGPHWLVAAGLEMLAAIAVAQGDALLAARLCAATATWRTSMGAPLQPARRAGHAATLLAARAALGDELFDAAWAEAATWRPEAAIAAALRLAPPEASPGPVVSADSYAASA